jgi:heterodisulfide reductase subunit B
MTREPVVGFTFFPGCSVVSTAWESNHSLLRACEALGFDLWELPDWNCCGSSSAYVVDQELGFQLTTRNLSLADPAKPLLVMCPRCLHHLRHVHLALREEAGRRRSLERRLRRKIPKDLEIIHFLEAVVKHGLPRLEEKQRRFLNGLKIAPYYGCTLFRPPGLRRQHYYQAEVENILVGLGARTVNQCFSFHCCGSFLSAVLPQMVVSQVNRIMSSAQAAGAECLVTVCAMCQLNLEIRNTLARPLPVFHFSEILALALGAPDYHNWFARHLVDPRPLLKDRGLIA